MSDLFNEAVADKEKLLEIAEANAKNKIIEAVTPRIKEMLDHALLGEMTEADEDDILLDLVTDPGESDPIPALDVVPSDDPMIDLPAGDLNTQLAPDAAGITLPDEDGKVTVDMDDLASGTQYDLSTESANVLRSLISTKKNKGLDYIELRTLKINEALKKLATINESTVSNQEVARQIKVECESLFSDLQQVKEHANESRVNLIENKLEAVFRTVMESYSGAGHLATIVEATKSLNLRAGKLSKNTRNQQLNESSVTKYVVSCFKFLKEAADLHKTVQGLYETLGTDDSIDSSEIQCAESNLSKLYTEIRQMANRKGKLLNEAEVRLSLSLPDELGEIDADAIQVSVVPAEDDEMDDLEGMDDMGDDDLDLDVADDEAPAMGPDDDVEEGDYLLNLDIPGDDEVDGEDVNVSVMDDEVPGEYDAEPAEVDLEEPVEEMYDDDDIVEIDENALLRELKKMKKLREEKYPIQHGGHGPGSDLSDFGDGDVEGESFEDSSESDLNVNEAEDCDELDELDELDEIDEGDDEDIVESRRRNVARKNAQRNKKNGLLEAKNKKLQAKLAESNLFNTKLIALNKVLQVPGLKKAQKLKIVETLDKGRTGAEVNKLYGKIVGALKKNAATLKESAQRSKASGTSKVMTSATATRKNDQLLEKWSRIAGTDLLQD